MIDDTPRGLRNNSPGNLRPPPYAVTAFDPRTGLLMGALPSDVWEGVIALDISEPDPPYLIFGDLSHGLRAISKTLMAYQAKNGCNTVLAIFSRWAPASDHNIPGSYAANVAQNLGVGINDPINTQDRQTLVELTQGIIREENGTAFENDISVQQIGTGVDMALGTIES